MTTHNGESFLHKLHDVRNDPRISANQKAKNQNILDLEKSENDIQNLNTIKEKLGSDEKYNNLLKEVQKYHNYNPSHYFPSDIVESLAKYYKKEEREPDVATQAIVDAVESKSKAKKR